MNSIEIYAGKNIKINASDKSVHVENSEEAYEILDSSIEVKRKEVK